MSLQIHKCEVPDAPGGVIVCVCAIGRDHDIAQFEAWEENEWRDTDA